MKLEDFDPLSGKRVEILDFEGNIVGEDLRPEELTDDLVLQLYDKMVMLRVADQQALTLQRAGRMGTYPPTLGQEATNIGSAGALEERRLGGAVVSGDGCHAVKGRASEVNLFVLDGM